MRERAKFAVFEAKIKAPGGYRHMLRPGAKLDIVLSATYFDNTADVASMPSHTSVVQFR
jgi:hypothetical protein